MFGKKNIGTKWVCKMLVKWTKGGNFINILQAGSNPMKLV